MTTSEPLADGDTPPDVENCSEITAMLTADITLTVSKDAVEATHMKTVFESVIVILTLVGVRLFLFFHSSVRLSGIRPG